MKISVVIPCYNSEKSIKEVVDLTFAEIAKMGHDAEFVLVNDNSRDGTFNVIKDMCEKDARVKGINLSRNFGQHNAIMAGLHYVTGDCVVGMDDDLQTHPSQLHKIIEKYEEGYDLVYGKYPKRKFPFYRNLGSRFAGLTARFLTDSPKNIVGTSFWAARRFVCEEALSYANSYPSVGGLFLRITRNVANADVEHYERQYGKSNYTLKALIRLWSAIMNFSIVPLRFALILGMIFSTIGFFSAAFIVVRKIIYPHIGAGWSSLMAAMLFLFGINLFCVGMLGEYIGRLFIASTKAPQYVIREKINC